MKMTKRFLAVLAIALLAGCSTSSESPAEAGFEIQPASVEVAPGDAVCFSAFLGGALERSVTWTVEEVGGGSVDESGNYTAPAAEGTFHVVASNGARSARAAIVVHKRAATDLDVQPKAGAVATGATLAFSASIGGVRTTAVTWSVEEGAGGGSIGDDGVYVAPQTPGVYHVVARSTADDSRSDSATVTVVAAAIPATRPQFYVSPKGSDANAGTLAEPWRTIQKSMNAATPGSTVNIMSGTYSERLSLNVSGTASQPIVFQNYGYAHSGSGPGAHAAGDEVVVDLSFLGTVRSASVSALMVANRAHVTLRGITFQDFTCLGGGPIYGIRITRSHDITVRDCRVLRFRNTGNDDGTNSLAAFYVDGGLGGDGTTAYDIVLDSNEFGDIVTTRSGENLSICGAHHVQVTNNWVHDHDSIGMDASSEYYGPTHDVVFRGNLIEYVARHRDGSYWWSPYAGLPLFCDGAYDVTIEQNVIRNSQGGITIDAERPGHASHAVVIRDNVVLNDSAKGIQLGTFYDLSGGSRVYDAQAYNNTLDGNAIGLLLLPNLGGVVFRNNVVTRSRSHGWSDPYGSAASADYNLWYGNAGGDGRGAHDVFANPLYVDAGGGDFSLQSGSPAIDAGDPATTSVQAGTVDYAGRRRFGGARIDIGAFEAN